LQNDYTVIFSGDPSLDLPENKDERARVLRVAHQTGNWDTLIKAGEKPTLFHLRHISGAARDYLDGENARRRLGPAEFATLIFRLGLKRIDNLDDFKVEHEVMDGFPIAKVDIVNKLRAAVEIGDAIVAEISEVIARKTFQAIDPL
jgi:hypothetical protein